MELYVQAFINGILTGGVYSLMAVGLSLIFGVMRVINFAHGDMMVWGMYLSLWLFTTLGLDPYLSIPLTGAAVFLLGAAIQRGLVNRILAAPHEMQILLMMGVALVLENLALMVWGPDPRRVNVSYGLSTFWMGPIVVDLPRLVTFALALALALCLYLFLRRTDLGRMIRAASDNQTGALLVGTDITKVFTLAFGVGAACVGAAGEPHDAAPAVHPQLRPLVHGHLVQHRDHRRDGEPAGGVRRRAPGGRERIAGCGPPGAVAEGDRGLRPAGGHPALPAAGPARGPAMTRRLGVGLGVGALLVWLPFTVSSVWQNLLITTFYFAYLGQAWNILGGYAGQLSLGHAAFFAIGAYTSVVLHTPPGNLAVAGDVRGGAAGGGWSARGSDTSVSGSVCGDSTSSC